jgi:hypothetical protein
MISFLLLIPAILVMPSLIKNGRKEYKERGKQLYKIKKYINVTHTIYHEDNDSPSVSTNDQRLQQLRGEIRERESAEALRAQQERNRQYYAWQYHRKY